MNTLFEEEFDGIGEPCAASRFRLFKAGALELRSGNN